MRVATQLARDRCRERIQRLSRSTMDRESVQREVIADLQRVIGFDRWCLPQADPDTLLPGAGLGDHDYGPGLPRALELEYSGADFAAKHDLARRPGLGEQPGRGDRGRPRPVTTVGRGAAPGRHRRHRRRRLPRRIRLLGLDRGLPGRLRAAVLRRRPRPARCGRPLDGGGAAAVGRRRTPGRTDPSDPPGVLVLDRDLRAVSRTDAASRWIAALPLADLFTLWGMLPAVIYPAATLARSGDLAHAHATLPGVNGRWIRIEAAPLDGDRDGDIAVTIRAASPAETFDLACRAHGLTARETAVMTELVAGLRDPRGGARPARLRLDGAGSPQVGVHQAGRAQPPRSAGPTGRHLTAATASSVGPGAGSPPSGRDRADPAHGCAPTARIPTARGRRRRSPPGCRSRSARRSRRA